MKTKSLAGLLTRLLIILSLCALGISLVFLGVDYFITLTSSVIKAYGKDLAKPYTNIPPEEISLEDARTDLKLMYDILREVHPSFTVKNQELLLQEKYKEIEERIIRISLNRNFGSITRTDLFKEYANMVTWIKDAHTFLRFYPSNLENAYSNRIPIEFEWVEESLVVSKIEDPGMLTDLNRGDEVVKIGDTMISDIVGRLGEVISSENEEWVRNRIAAMLSYEYTYRILGIDIEDTEFTFRNRFGKYYLEEMRLYPISAHSVAELEKRHWFGWVFEHGSNYNGQDIEFGYFWLDNCTNSGEYVRSVDTFFQEVRHKNVNTVVIDLRNNTGGDSSVADAFLKYLPLDKIRDYSAEIRASGAMIKMRGFNSFQRFMRWIRTGISAGFKKVDRPENPSLIFTGNVLILTSNQTFSSANYFAVLLKDNLLAKTVGEKTGNAPTAYGDVLSFPLKKTGYEMVVSSKYFKRPDTSLNSQRSLEPDIPVYSSVLEYQMGIDPQMNWLRANLP
jgi:C-terminal processing protease CtpA/Prc